MFKYYTQDNLAYLYLNASIQIHETYTINPLDISGSINIDLDSKCYIFGIEIIPASYISHLESLTKIRQFYSSREDILLIEFINVITDSNIINNGSFYEPPHLLNKNIEIGLLKDKISYFKIQNASQFFPAELLVDKDIEILKLP